MMLLALWPQINMWIARGQNWQGSYVAVQGDEVAYSAYLNALIDGRPRRNDPYTGRDDSRPANRLPESLFSIQFIPAYAIALPARLLGADHLDNLHCADCVLSCQRDTGDLLAAC